MKFDQEDALISVAQIDRGIGMFVGCSPLTLSCCRLELCLGSKPDGILTQEYRHLGISTVHTKLTPSGR